MDGNGTFDAAQGRIASISVFAAPETWEQIFESPPLGPSRDPCVIARTMTASEEHRVDGGTSAERSPPWPRERSAVSGLHNRAVTPARRGTHQSRPRRRYRHGFQRLPTAGLYKKHSDAVVLRQPRRDYASGRSRADDNVVITVD
jgi:hypothetical protein